MRSHGACRAASWLEAQESGAAAEPETRLPLLPKLVRGGGRGTTLPLIAILTHPDASSRGEWRLRGERRAAATAAVAVRRERGGGEGARRRRRERGGGGGSEEMEREEEEAREPAAPRRYARTAHARGQQGTSPDRSLKGPGGLCLPVVKPRPRLAGGLTSTGHGRHDPAAVNERLRQKEACLFIPFRGKESGTHAEAGHRQQPWPTRRWMKALPRPPLPSPLLPPLLAILRQKSVRVVRSEATREAEIEEGLMGPSRNERTLPPPRNALCLRGTACPCNGGDEERSRPPLPPGTAARKTNPARTPQLTRLAPAPPTTRSDAQGEGRGG
ncbi:unnamed protein product [Lampetra fluviatilis]